MTPSRAWLGLVLVHVRLHLEEAKESLRSDGLIVRAVELDPARPVIVVAWRDTRYDEERREEFHLGDESDEESPRAVAFDIRGAMLED